MSRLIDLDKALKPITRYKNILKHNQYVSNAEVAKVEAIEWFIHEQEPVKAIPLDKVKQAREEIAEMRKEHNVSVTDCLDVLDRLIEEVEE